MCNASDNAGRYAYNKQPEVCKWNLQKLAEALEPELPLALAEAILAEDYDAEFRRHYLHKMRRKLGLVRAACEEDAALVARLLETMQQTGECWRPRLVGLSPLFPLSHFSAHRLAALGAVTLLCSHSHRHLHRPQLKLHPHYTPAPHAPSGPTFLLCVCECDNCRSLTEVRSVFVLISLHIMS